MTKGFRDPSLQIALSGVEVSTEWRAIVSAGSELVGRVAPPVAGRLVVLATRRGQPDVAGRWRTLEGRARLPSHSPLLSLFPSLARARATEKSSAAAPLLPSRAVAEHFHRHENAASS